MLCSHYIYFVHIHCILFPVVSSIVLYCTHSLLNSPSSLISLFLYSPIALILNICHLSVTVCLSIPSSFPSPFPSPHPSSLLCPCLSKECFFNSRMLLHNSNHYANISCIQCIRVRTNLHWVIFIRKERVDIVN